MAFSALKVMTTAMLAQYYICETRAPESLRCSLFPTIITTMLIVSLLDLLITPKTMTTKILRIVSYVEVFGVKLPPAEAEVYTLSTDSWRRSVISFESDSEPNVGSIFQTHAEVCLFLNGALHCVAST